MSVVKVSQTDQLGQRSFLPLLIDKKSITSMHIAAGAMETNDRLAQDVPALRAVQIIRSPP